MSISKLTLRFFDSEVVRPRKNPKIPTAQKPGMFSRKLTPHIVYYCILYGQLRVLGFGVSENLITSKTVTFTNVNLIDSLR